MSEKADTLNGSETLGFPNHVGIILDGNRRFAKSLGLDPRKGHEYGEKKIEKLLDWCKEYGILELTLYTFSVQNFNRPKPEFDYITKLFVQGAKKLLNDERLEKYDIRVKFIGRTHMFSEEIQKLMKQIEEKTANNSKYKINFAMAYGGREEIIDGVNDLLKDVKSGKINAEKINDKTFEKYLYLNSEPDLIIRTGGEQRTSNFLPWQSTYSEWIFLKKPWPEFEKKDFLTCLQDFSNRERRMGK